jgi:hypothetical protein
MRIFTYVFIISGIMALLYFGGFTDLPTGNTIAILISGGLGNIMTSDLYTKLSTVLLLVGTGGAVIAGLFGRNIDVTLLQGGFIAWFSLMFLTNLVWLYEKFSGYGDFYTIIAGLIFVPLIIGFIISIKDWWTGTD